ncbi:hypothetical protein [Streptomyces sp. NPDC093089]|uniref:hypothetical protein n=1 Tax=Streptomyces sp. NPDC093089 TaxID=3366024 RepID=UPI0037F5D526
MNATLPAPVEDVDGGALVEVRTITKPWIERYRHRAKRVVLGYLGAILAVAVITAIVGHERTATAGAVFTVWLGAMAAVPLRFGAMDLGSWFHETRLRRHGVTVVAMRADAPMRHQCADSSGTTRVISAPSHAPSVHIAYDPQDPSKVAVLRDRAPRLLEITLGPGGILLRLGGIAFVLYLARMAILGETLS